MIMEILREIIVQSHQNPVVCSHVNLAVVW